MNGFSQHALDGAARVLDAMERAFNRLTNAGQQAVKFGRIMGRLVGPFSRPDAVGGVLRDIGLPVIPDKAFIADNVAVLLLATHKSSPMSRAPVATSHTNWLFGRNAWFLP